MREGGREGGEKLVGLPASTSGSPCLSSFYSPQYGKLLSSRTFGSEIASACSSDVSRSLLASRFPAVQTRPGKIRVPRLSMRHVPGCQPGHSPMMNWTRSGCSFLRASKSLVKRMSPVPLSCESGARYRKTATPAAVAGDLSLRRTDAPANRRQRQRLRQGA